MSSRPHPGSMLLPRSDMKPAEAAPATSHGRTCPSRRRRSRTESGFSLVELLTVVGIIALLIGILLPTMNASRIEAKRGATRAFLASCERGVEMFNTDFGQYPDSRRRIDPVIKWPAIDGTTPSDGEWLTGAHWLARAMVGHDGQGVDYGGLTLAAQQHEWDRFNVDPSNGRPLGDLKKRRGRYVDKAVYRMDINACPRSSPTAPGPRTGRIVLLDTFEYPVIYYRANARAENGFALDSAVAGSPPPIPGNAGDGPGVYTHEDNAAITGLANDPGWDFANNGATKYHGLGDFGTTVAASFNPKATPSDSRKGASFTGYLHNADAFRQARTVKPVKETSFVLITAGPDGIYGTPDDVSNFR